MGWVTLDDDQRVFIGPGGKVAATRAQISKAGGASERGRALAARSKAAIGRATAGKGDSPATTRAIEHAKAAGDASKAPTWVKGNTGGINVNWKSIRHDVQQNQKYNRETVKRRSVTTAQLTARLKSAH